LKEREAQNLFMTKQKKNVLRKSEERLKQKKMMNDESTRAFHQGHFKDRGEKCKKIKKD
jgi:hypothetical protein